MKFSLRKTEILRGYKSFSDVLSKGISLSQGLVKSFVVTEPGHGSLKVGFSVSRKFRKAVDRNRIKRHLREAFRLNRFLLDEKRISSKDVRIVFILVGSLPKVTREKWGKQIHTHVRKLLKGINDKLGE